MTPAQRRQQLANALDAQRNAAALGAARTACLASAVDRLVPVLVGASRVLDTPADAFRDDPRFAARISPSSDGCWNWTGSVDSSGYGTLQRRPKMWSAHRWAWTLTNGPIPPEMTVDHLCYVPVCVNPAHLRLLSRSENARLQRTLFRGECANGHPFSGDNLAWATGPTGLTFRVCRQCRMDRARRYRERRAASPEHEFYVKGERAAAVRPYVARRAS